jgi:hypothetical protein
MEIIIGAVVSLIVQWAKQKFTSEWQTLGFLLIISMGAAGLYAALVAVGYWQTIASVIMTAGAFYAFILQRFEGGSALVSPEDLES